MTLLRNSASAIPIAAIAVIAAIANPAFAEAPPFTCAARLEAARAELLAAQFDPAKDTATWLQVRSLDDGGIMLNVFTVYSPDGDGYRTYQAELHPGKGEPAAPRAGAVAKAGRWRLGERRVLDEFKEERLPERTWRRTAPGWVATVHTRTEDRKLVDQFESIVKPALDECLAHPGAVGSSER